MASSFTEGMAKWVLEAEHSPARFERFCCALFSSEDGRDYVPTSSTYDLGRDGRTADAQDAKPPSYLCASLRVDAIDKASEDARRLAETTPAIDTVRFCSNQRLTEDRLDRIEAVFTKTLPGANSTEADGSIQLAALAVQHSAIFEQFYLAEIQNLRDSLGVEDAENEHLRVTGMRIALTTQLSDDAHGLREDLQKNLVLTALSDGRSRTLEALTTQISSMLHVARSIQPEYLQSALDSHNEQGLVAHQKQLYTITDAGRCELQKRTESGLASLAQGQTLFKSLIANLSGSDLKPEQFSRLWAVAQDYLSQMFLDNGIYVAESIASILNEESQLKDHPDLRERIQELGDKVEALGFWGARRGEIAQAVVDVFRDQKSQAFLWLCDLCVVYITLCMLGLDSRAHQQMSARLREIDLFWDTDIVLSFLSRGESQHEAIAAMLKAWRRINGQVYVTPGVLEEAAYHAWISQRDYEETWRLLEKMDDSEAQYLIENAFVRGFRAEAEGRFEPKRWGYYIFQYRGRSEYDYSSIAAILKDDGVQVAEDEGIDMEFADSVKKTCLALDKGDSSDDAFVPKEVADKCRRDGLLMAALLQRRAVKDKLGGGTALVVSSSRRLRRACSHFREQFGEPLPVVPVGAIAYYLTLIPGTRMTVGTLKSALFDAGFAPRLAPLDRTALRVLKASEQYFLPFSRRGALRREMSRRLHDMATERGESLKKIERAAAQGDPKIADDFATIVAKSVDTITRSEYEEELHRLRREAKEREQQS